MTLTHLLNPGDLLQKRYEVGHAIGKGGMGFVYQVTDLRLGKRLALKQILGETTQLRQAFQREAQLLASLHHDSLPDVSDHFSEGDSDFIVMDYIDGDDLATLVQNGGAQPVAQVLSWADQLLDVLIYLHTRRPDPVIHRDIKPQNIKYTARGRLFLLDFGIAKGSIGERPATDQSIAAKTPHYAPPEQSRPGGTDARSDLYSCGATLYFLLSAQRPAAADARQTAFINGEPDPLLPLDQINPQVPPPLAALIQRTMALRAADRPATAAELRSALAAFQDAAPVEPIADATDLSLVEVGRPAVTDAPLEPPPLVVTPPAPQPTSATPPAPPAGVSVVQPRGGPRSSTESSGRSGTSGPQTFQKRIYALVRQTLDSYPGAWMVWSDPNGEWRPLLERVAADERMGGFLLLCVEGRIGDEVGDLQARQAVQARIAARESFVLLVPAAADRLGWLWGQALLAERRYTTTLREQLLAWGWRPHKPTIADSELVALARQGLQQDPVAWGGGGLQPNLPLLLDILAGGANPAEDEAYLLALTIEQVGLPVYQEAAQERWRTRALAQLLVSQAQQVAPRLIPATHELLIPEAQRGLALSLLAQWVDSLRLSKGLAQAIQDADKVAMLGGLLHEATIKQGPFLSRVAEQTLFVALCRRLAERSGKDLLQALASMSEDLARHAAGFWGDPGGSLAPSLVIPWSELLRLSLAAQQLLDVSTERTWQSIDEAISWYTTGGWQLDRAGEEILRGLNVTTPDLLALVTPLREAYRARWERTLIDWSDLWTNGGCKPLPLSTAGEWLTTQLKAPQQTAIIVIDALRYDLGLRLAELINTAEGADRAFVQPARTPLPSITALGMGAALPLSESSLRAELVGSEWRLIEASSGSNLSQAAQRRAWLLTRNIITEDGFVSVADALRGQIPPPSRVRKRLFITDDMIDQLGHDDELELLGAGLALDRYRDLVARLRAAGWRRIVIVTDHGFIHWSGSSEKRQTPPVTGAAYRSRRALAYPPETRLPEPHAHAPGGQWQVLTARGAACWSAYGGLGYFHGGASLQETVIPCIRIEWPSQARPLDVRVQAVERILSLRPRIVLLVERGSLLIEDALSRTVDVVIRHAQDRAILFRSDQIEITPDQDQVAVQLRLMSGAAAAWDAPLRIEVRDATTEDVIAEAASTLRARLDEW
jgi:serine/threonine protein kinase